jgi:hypothetical protein
MRKWLAADNGHKQSSEKAVAYDSDVSEGVQGSDCVILLENDLVV